MNKQITCTINEDEGLVSIFANGVFITELSDDNGEPEGVLSWFVDAYEKTNAALLAKFKEQGANTMEHFEQQTESADFVRAFEINSKHDNEFYRHAKSGTCLEHLNSAGAWIPGLINESLVYLSGEYQALYTQKNHLDDADYAVYIGGNKHGEWVIYKAVGDNLAWFDGTVWKKSTVNLDLFYFALNFIDLKSMSRDHIDNCHHIALQIEDLGIQHLHHIDLATTAGALNDVVEKVWTTSEQQEDMGPGVDLKYHDIDEDGKMTPVCNGCTVGDPALTNEQQKELKEELDANDKPVFTQEMEKAGELPPVGADAIFSHGGQPEVGTVIVITVRFIIYLSKDGFERVRKIDNASIKPIDNRTGSERLHDAVWEATELRARDGAAGVVSRLLASDKFTITIKE